LSNSEIRAMGVTTLSYAHKVSLLKQLLLNSVSNTKLVWLEKFGFRAQWLHFTLCRCGKTKVKL